ncbi:MAG: amidase [Saccharospirillum sp.]
MIRTDPFMTRVDTPLTTLNTGPLFGLKLAVKDLFAIAGHTTGAGNPDWLADQEPAQHTATAVALLQQAGAALVGTTLTDELAYSLMGRNAHYGALANPRDPKRVSGGSSAGSAVAVAMGLADIGLGTDTGGSIRVPASFCGLYGFRPSHGVVSTEGLTGLAPPFDTVGWMTSNLNTLSQVGHALLPADKRSVAQQLSFWWPESWDADLRDRLLDQLAQAGLHPLLCQLPESVMADAAEAFRILQGRAIARLHGDWVQHRQPNFGTDIAERFGMALALTDEDEQRACQRRCHLAQWLNTPGYVILPTTAGAAPRLNATAAELQTARKGLLELTAFAGLSGRPQLHLPWLTHDSAPWGLSLMAPRYGDRALLALAGTWQALLAGTSGPIAPL